MNKSLALKTWHTAVSPAIILAALLFLSDGAQHKVQAERSSQGPVVIQGASQSAPVTPGVFRGDLRDVPKTPGWKQGDPVREIPRRVYPHPQTKRSVSPPAQPSPDPLLEQQDNATTEDASRVFTTPDLNFEGTSFTGVTPPDTVGDVGLNHYIQMVNNSSSSALTIYDKSGTLLVGPILLSSLWNAGGDCANGHGDPVVLYDRLADRWLMSEFAATGNHLCVYISQTADPISGGWFNYDFPTPNFPDYPKYAVWPDAYYVSSNEPSPAVYALDRNQMLAGNPATSQRFSAPALVGFGFQALTPSDLDGATTPPLGSPNYFIRHLDDEVHGPPTDPDQDFLEIWEFHVDFANPNNSTFTGPTNIAVTEFDSDLCGLSSFFCFPQPNIEETLDPLREVVMWRAQYRNFGTHETLVGNLVTDVEGTDHGGIRWFELRKTEAGPWTLFQEGTYAPDQDHRWMGSIAMDASGNIALGYSVSSSTVFPSIRYAGRLVSDPDGTLPQGEATLMAGSGSQTISTRWGDYSSMNVDPADDCTFWYTNEYMPANGLWNTRIGTFRFESCGGEPPPDCPACQIEAGLVAGTAEGAGGDTISVPIEAFNSPTDVDSLGFEVHFDATKLAFTGCDFTGTFLENWTFKDCNSPQPGVVVVGGFTADAGIPLGDSGPVVHLNFDVVACEEGQQCPLELMNFVDDIATWESCAGCFTCVICDGDVNGDGPVTPADAQIVFGCFLGQGACTPTELARGDINRDGSLTPEDAQCIFNKFLQRPPEEQCACFLP